DSSHLCLSLFNGFRAEKPKGRGSEWADHIRTAHTSKDVATFEDFGLFTIDHLQKRRESCNSGFLVALRGHSQRNQVNEFYQKGCQEESAASTGGEMFSRDPAHGS